MIRSGVWAPRRGDRRWQWLAVRLPRRLVMWAYARVVVHASSGQYGGTRVSELRVLEALRRFDPDGRW